MTSLLPSFFVFFFSLFTTQAAEADGTGPPTEGTIKSLKKEIKTNDLVRITPYDLPFFLLLLLLLLLLFLYHTGCGGRWDWATYRRHY